MDAPAPSGQEFAGQEPAGPAPTGPATADPVTGTPVAIIAPAHRRHRALSPINRRRWENFKANRRGYFALWLFSILFVVSLFAEFIANDKPFLVMFDGKAFISPRS